MGLYDYLFGPSEAERAAAQRAEQQRAAALRARQQRARAQQDAQARLCQSPTQRSGTLPCGVPIRSNPCDLLQLKVGERKTGLGQAPWVGTDPEPRERANPVDFFITSTGTPNANPYRTGAIIEVTAGGPTNHPRTTITLTVVTNYQFCTQERHPHLVIVDPQGQNTTLRGETVHSFPVFRRGRATDNNRIGGFLDIWPARWGHQDYRVNANVCGVRRGGAAVRSQNTVIRVYPADQWELDLRAPSLASGSVRHGTNTWDEANPTSRTTLTGTVNTRDRVYTATGERNASGGEAAWTGSASGRAAGNRNNNIETRVRAELKRNGQSVLGLDWILGAVNAFRNIERTINEIWEAIRNFRPKVGWDFNFSLEVLTGQLKATWGFKENLDRRVFFAYSISVRLVLLKVSLSVGFGVDLTIRGYGFIANIEGKIEANFTVSADVERKSIAEPEWKFARFRSDFPVTLTARGMAIHDRVLSLSAGAETGFESDGRVGFDAQGFGVHVTKIEFKGITLKGRATVVSLFDVDVDYRVMQKRQIGGPLRFPS